MNRLPYSGMMRPRSSGTVERWSHRALFSVFLILWCLVVVRQFPAIPLFPGSDWPEPTLLVATTLVTVSALALETSLQSALMAAAVIGLLGGVAHWVSYVTRLPFGPLEFPHADGSNPFQGWFFVPALIWVVVLLNARGLARLVLEPAGKNRNHGLHVLGLSVLLTVAMAMALEPFASKAHRYWLWGETRLPVTWQNVPLSSLFAWGVVSLIASIAATPFLIDKHPRPVPPSRQSAWVWVLLSGLFTVGTALRDMWPAAAVGILNGGMALAMAFIVGKRRKAAGASRSD